MAQPATEASAPLAAKNEELHLLYEADEDAWLDETVRLIRAGQVERLDYENLAEYLEAMAKRERRRIESRLTTLITHLLKWEYQPSHRSKSWKLTIVRNRRKILSEFTKTLRRHAGEFLSTAYQDAAKDAVIETDLPRKTFPDECPYSLDWILTEELF